MKQGDPAASHAVAFNPEHEEPRGPAQEVESLQGVVSHKHPVTAEHSAEEFFVGHVVDRLASTGAQFLDAEVFHVHPDTDKHWSSYAWRLHCSAQIEAEGAKQKAVFVPFVTVVQ